MIQKKEAMFLLKFFTIFLVLEYLILTIDFSFFQNFLAQSIATILGLDYSGKYIFVDTGTFEIVASCTGLVSASVLASIIFSLKKPVLKQKIALFTAGFVLLLILNYFRVLLVTGVGKAFGLGLAEVVHVISWLSTALIVLVLWYYGTKKVAKVRDFKGFL